MVGSCPEVDAAEVVWVEAAPFRAQLDHLMTVGGMSVEVVAALTGIPPRAARRLLRGHAGRPVRRISAETGRRLLGVTGFEAMTVRERNVAAADTVARLRRLIGSGLSPGQLAVRSGVRGTVLDDLRRGRVGSCSALVAAQVAALHTALGLDLVPLEDDDGDSRTLAS